MPNENKKTYSSVGWFGNLAEEASAKIRTNIFNRLAQWVPLSSLGSVLDVGVSSDEKSSASVHYFEEMFPEKHKLTAFSDQDASWMEQRYPGLTFIRGDGRVMPFADNSFDLVFSSAVIEHVGSLSQQRAFLNECCRVSKRYVFLTTPNRWHPIELHTALPLLHWLPKAAHRKMLSALGYAYLSQESTLNLLGRRDIEQFCKDIGLSQYSVATVNFLGLPSNLLLMASV